ncbi:hypothetical protein B0H17DRAFT_1206361 [Mycena rosella]|uniref:CCHC-type domain-containing protein n=1 Tax=Mycena rosella TaxID=1033263 RepID=A0AAD7D5H9_MYCRO|nr:hypothetical protein B0H17DRAFT_1206361 [Mycena rosella]
MSKNQKTKNKFLDAISSDPMSTRSSTRTRRAPTDIVTPAPAAAMSSMAADPASTLTPPATPTSVDPSLPAPPPKPTERSAEAREQQVAATKLKKEFITRSTERIDDADSFDALAEVFGDVLQWTQFNKTISVEFWKVLKAIQERLVNHLTIVRELETTSSFSALLLQSVSPALKQLAERSEAQHKAIVSLSKELEKPKIQQILSYAAVAAASASSSRPAAPKPRPPPLPSPCEERILVRFDGETPPIFHASYPEIVSAVNKHLQFLSLPLLLYAQKQNASSIFLVPSTPAKATVLAKEWLRWSPGILPGGRIAPVALHSHLQVDGILFRDVGDMKELKREFELRNPDLGKVIGTPTWVNRPPSESRTAAIVAGGGKPKLAGSVYFLLESRDRVDLALSRGRILLCSSSPAVSRGFPHLRVSQCWGCHKYGHTKARCNVKNPCCGVCAKPLLPDHPFPCSGPVQCLNRPGKHRSDSYSCPKRKELAVSLAARQRELHLSLDKSSSFPLPYANPVS